MLYIEQGIISFQGTRIEYENYCLHLRTHNKIKQKLLFRIIDVQVTGYMKTWTLFRLYTQPAYDPFKNLRID